MKTYKDNKEKYNDTVDFSFTLSLYNEHVVGCDEDEDEQYAGYSDYCLFTYPTDDTLHYTDEFSYPASNKGLEKALKGLDIECEEQECLYAGYFNDTIKSKQDAIDYLVSCGWIYDGEMEEW